MAKNPGFLNMTFEQVVNRLVTNGFFDRDAYSAVKWILKEGYHFSAEELRSLARTKQPNGWTTAHDLVSNGYFYSHDELMLLENPECCGGWTVSHEMAKHGHNFSVDELLKMGNPTDDRGLTVADVMTFNGFEFTENDAKRLEIDHSNSAYTAYVSFYIRRSLDRQPTPQPTTCTQCGHSLTQSSVDKSKYVSDCLSHYDVPVYYYSYLFICNHCHWWCIRESWAERQRLQDFDYLVVGVAKNKTSAEIDSRPWERAFVDENLYSHSLIMTDKIRELFSVK